MSALDQEERRLVEFKLQDYTNEEIASQMGCSERTVRRLTKQVRERRQARLLQTLDEELPS